MKDDGVKLLVGAVVERTWSPRTMSSWGFFFFGRKEKRSADGS